MPFSTHTIVRVATADIAMQMAFPRSISRWQRGQDPWKHFDGDCGPLLIGKNDGIVIDGDCSNGVSAPHGGLIHICGNLYSTLDVGGHCEIVIAGNVDRDALIRASEFGDVFIGGRFSGDFISSGWSKIWIESDFEGSIKTGSPSTYVYVGRDYSGNVSPENTPALLSLTIAGFASQASLMKIADRGYTEFHGSVAQSDVPPGLYPKHKFRRSTQRGNSFNRWCVETQRRTQKISGENDSGIRVL